MKLWKKVLFDTIKKSRAVIFGLIVAFVSAAVIFYFYNLSAEPFIYAAVIVSFFEISIFAVAYVKELSKAKKRETMINSVLTDTVSLSADTLAEKDFLEAIRLLKNKLTEIQNEYENKRQEDVDYYTVWVHQIKTPIAVMRMELGGNSEMSQVLSGELFRIEQYVDMVLQYIRIESESNDLLIKEYSLDELIREAVRKYAHQFVQKKLSLDYKETDKIIVTDKKWFSSVIEQILSNAIKYTPSGTITISLKDGVLSISDTGIGIAKEDIPRIFEKGYTGENGRIEKHSSGLGLNLCKKAAALLNIPLSVESAVGKGSKFSLNLTEILKH